MRANEFGFSVVVNEYKWLQSQIRIKNIHGLKECKVEFNSRVVRSFRSELETAFS